MEVEKLNQYLKETDGKADVKEQQFWKDVVKMYIREKVSYYECLSTREAVWSLISERNYKERSQAHSCEELGVWIRVGDICFIDFGINYLNEAGFQHFGLIISISNNKVLVIPMTSNEKTMEKAKLASMKNVKSHLLMIGKIQGMHKASTLFLNDAKFINSARIIDVKAHITVESKLFKKIIQSYKDMII